MTDEKSSRRSIEGLLLGVAFGVFAMLLVWYGTRGWLLPIASRHGAGIDRMMVYLLITTGALFFIGHMVLGYSIWKFGARRKIRYRTVLPRIERRWSVALGIVMALIAEGGVLVLGLPVLGDLYGDPPADSILVEAWGEQFAWNFRYPGEDNEFGRTGADLISLQNPLGLDAQDQASQDDRIINGVMFLPVNRAGRLRVKAKDVIHSFFLPHFRVKQDAVPGLGVEVWFVPTETGTFEIACTELCGFGHYKMRAVLEVVSQEEFNQILEEEPAWVTFN